MSARRSSSTHGNVAKVMPWVIIACVSTILDAIGKAARGRFAAVDERRFLDRTAALAAGYVESVGDRPCDRAHRLLGSSGMLIDIHPVPGAAEVEGHSPGQVIFAEPASVSMKRASFTQTRGSPT